MRVDDMMNDRQIEQALAHKLLVQRVPLRLHPADGVGAHKHFGRAQYWIAT